MTTSLTTAIGANVTDRPKAQVVEIDAAGLTWIKSSISGTQSGSGCVELARAGDRTFIRDSHDRSGAWLSTPALTSLLDWLR